MQKKPTSDAEKTYQWCRKDLPVMQKRPTSDAEKTYQRCRKDLPVMQERPTSDAEKFHQWRRLWGKNWHRFKLLEQRGSFEGIVQKVYSRCADIQFLWTKKFVEWSIHWSKTIYVLTSCRSNQVNKNAPAVISFVFKCCKNNLADLSSFRVDRH